MSWSRFDDNWADKIRTLDLSFEARWHYLSMIQFCSRTNLRSGSMKASDARTCSDVPDPQDCLEELIEAGLVTRDTTLSVTPKKRDRRRDAERYVVVAIAEHLPSDDKDKQRARQERHRKHLAGDHSNCNPRYCREADVTRDPGRDGPGQEEPPPASENVTEQPWPALPPRPGGVDVATGELDEDDWLASIGCQRCFGQGCPDCVTTTRSA